MTRVDSKYVLSKLQSGVKVLCVNLTSLQILDCGSMTVDNLIKALANTTCFFFSKDDTDTETETTSEE